MEGWSRGSSFQRSRKPAFGIFFQECSEEPEHFTFRFHPAPGRVLPRLNRCANRQLKATGTPGPPAGRNQPEPPERSPTESLQKPSRWKLTRTSQRGSASQPCSWRRTAGQISREDDERDLRKVGRPLSPSGRPLSPLGRPLSPTNGPLILQNEASPQQKDPSPHQNEASPRQNEASPRWGDPSSRWGDPSPR